MSTCDSIGAWILTTKMGEEEAFRGVSREFSSIMRDYARRKLPRSITFVDPDDIVQEALAKFVLGRRKGYFNRLEDREYVRSVLLRLTKFAVYNAIESEWARKRWRNESDLDVGSIVIPNSDTTFAQVSFQDDLELFESQLPNKQRCVLDLILAGHSRKSIREELHCCATTVWSHVNRIRQSYVDFQDR